MTYLQILYRMRDDLQVLINKFEDRKKNQQNRYEQYVAIGQCTAAKSCSRKPVPQHKMCAYHLRKTAQYQERCKNGKP